MVSLDISRSSGGGYFFGLENSTNNADVDESSLLSNALVSEQEPRYKAFPLVGWIAIAFEAVAMHIMLFLIFVKFSCFILCMVHVSVWFLFLVACFIRHRSCGIMKRFGYLEFYRKTRLLIKVPFIVVSLGNTLALVSFSVVASFCSPNTANIACPVGSVMHCKHYIMIIYGLEYLVVLPFLIHSIYIIIDFNQKKALPDVQQDDLLISCIHSQIPTGEIGFRDGDFKEEVLEKQADMIRYLRQHNIYLARKVVKLTTELEEACATEGRE